MHNIESRLRRLENLIQPPEDEPMVKMPDLADVWRFLDRDSSLKGKPRQYYHLVLHHRYSEEDVLKMDAEEALELAIKLHATRDDLDRYDTKPFR